MRIESIKISNFRGITDVNLTSLGGMVIIAGQNGSGKSCIFDAIRLLKSLYGGYQANELHHWLGEFQINLTGKSSNFSQIFNNKAKDIVISCDFKISDEEATYIVSNADELLREKIWKTIIPEAYGWAGNFMATYAAQFRDREPEVAKRASEEQEKLIAELAKPFIRGRIVVPPNGYISIENSVALSLVFSIFRPRDIGVIDFHGSQRHYTRENVSGINLNLDQLEQQRSQSALYNYSTKYTNVKGEMAGSYIKDMLARQAGVPEAEQSSLTTTLKELFSTFFSDKEFLGPQPTANGGLSFPVRTTSGGQHDLDELSSGEKEILYGYLRIRNSAPKHSIILLDEPELHLNPRLIRGLPQFYKKNIGDALGNQIWLVTHSDTLLREVVATEGYNVYHMLPCSSILSGKSQLKPLSLRADLDRVIVDLVGDLATYRPGEKVVLFEGGGDSDFDQSITGRLFPELLLHANLVSGSNKIRVRALQEVLEVAANKGQLPFKFICITDKDSGPVAESASVNVFAWDVYHIENYLIEPIYIKKVLESISIRLDLTIDEIFDELRSCAEDILPQLVRHEISAFANGILVGAINTRSDPKSGDISDKLHEAIMRSQQKVEVACSEVLTKDKLIEKETEIRHRHSSSLADGSWLAKLPGRNILKRFAGKHASSISYEVFRNLILSAMIEQGHKPRGMKSVIDQILAI